MATDNGPTVAVSEVFGPTIQGEGPTMGRPAGFVRLAGCNLSCAWCDTPYTWDWKRFNPRTEIKRLHVGEILASIEWMAVRRIVITGGEPLLQPKGVDALLEDGRGFAVEIETAGTLAPTTTMLQRVDQWNVSPKLESSGNGEERFCLPALEAIRDNGKRVAWKFVLREPSEFAEVDRIVESLGLDRRDVWISPEGVTTEAMLASMRRLVDATLTREFNLGSRLHVLLWGSTRGR